MLRALLAPIFLISFASVSHAQDRSQYGHFEGSLNIQLLGDGRDGKLLDAFIFDDPNKKQWIAPQGLITDGASIPRVLWSVAGSPWTGLYRDAAVIHDAYCDTHTEPWQAVHKVFLFRDAGQWSPVQSRQKSCTRPCIDSAHDGTLRTRQSKCDNCASVPYYVKHFTPAASTAKMKAIKERIEQSDPSLDEIESDSDAAINVELTRKQVGTPSLIR